MLLILFITVQKICTASTCKIFRTGAIVQDTAETIRRQDDVSFILFKCGSRSGALCAITTNSACSQPSKKYWQVFRRDNEQTILQTRMASR